jgi:hypothetical protein
MSEVVVVVVEVEVKMAAVAAVVCVCVTHKHTQNTMDSFTFCALAHACTQLGCGFSCLHWRNKFA